VLDKETDKLWEIGLRRTVRRPPLRHARQLFVHDSEDDYRAWLAHELKKQQSGEPTEVAPPEADAP